MQNPALWVRGGIAGVIAVVCYIAAIATDWPEHQLGVTSSLIVISAFPILGIMYIYALYDFVAAERESAANRLALVFWIVAFTTLLSMIIVQLAVTASIGDITRDLDANTARALRRGLRTIDLGLDVAWDFLGATGLILSGIAMRARSGLGRGWGIPAIGFGIALIVLNAATFPTPPANGGLFDIGPFTGLFMLALAIRLAFLGRRETRVVGLPRVATATS